MVTVFGAAARLGSKDYEAAQRVVEFLTSAEAAAVFKARGFDPP
jgi:hypothetical protein